MNEQEFATLFKVSQELGATLDLTRLLQTATDRVTELANLKSAAVYLLEGDVLHLRAATPPLPPQFPREYSEAPLAAHPHVREAITTRTPVSIADTAVAALTPEEQAIAELRHLRSVLYLPLLARQQALGALIVGCVMEPCVFTQAQLDICHALSNMLAMAVANARLYEASLRNAAELEQRMNERRLIEQALLENEARYRYMFQANPHPMWVFDMETLRFLAVNDAAIAHYGYSMEEFLSMTIEDIRPAEDLPRLTHALNHPVEAGIDEAGVWRHRKRDGTLIDVEITSHRLEFGGRQAELVLAHDITQRRQAEERVRKLAHYDSLTGLPNRALFADRVNQAISMAQRSHEKLALLFVDVDHFKNINDSLGHRIGDELLIEAAQRLLLTVRTEDTVARLGGDEFIILLPNTDNHGAAHVASKLLQAVSQHYLIKQHELAITLSIGIGIYPGDGEDFETLSKCADIAMYRAKRDGRNNYRFFTPEMQARSAYNLLLENSLRRAQERDQLQLHYQPQVSLFDGRIIGVEALLRWQHQALGMVPPDEFIPVAEDSGVIQSIGEWALRTAIRQLKRWMENGMAPMTMSVNLSAVQFRQPRLVRMVTQILQEENLPSEYLELELTEGTTMSDPETAVAVLDDLHACGVRLSIDDFGTGYSSLSYLKRFQVSKLKIDRSFVQDIVENQDDQAIVKAIINLANGLGLKTIAEGVETGEQLEFLRDNGCNEIQGYYYSRPLNAGEFERFARGASS